MGSDNSHTVVAEWGSLVVVLSVGALGTSSCTPVRCLEQPVLEGRTPSEQKCHSSTSQYFLTGFILIFSLSLASFFVVALHLLAPHREIKNHQIFL